MVGFWVFIKRLISSIDGRRLLTLALKTLKTIFEELGRESSLQEDPTGLVSEELATAVESFRLPAVSVELLRKLRSLQDVKGSS